MAKKRRPSPKISKALWPTSDVATLLAWLDHSLKHNDLDFESTVVFRLNQLYTFAQIKRKLSSIWHNYGPEDKPGWPPSLWKDDIFAHGSACLDCINALEDGISDKIAESLKTFEDEYRSRQAQPAARRLRSTSRQNDFPLLQGTPDTVQTTTRSPQKRKYRPLSKSLTPSVIKREIGQVQSPVERTQAVKKRQRIVLEKACILCS